MLGDPGWYARPDCSLPQWCILVVETEQRDGTTMVTGWEMASANPHQILRIEESQNKDDGEEGDILRGLLSELEGMRQENPILVTKHESTIQLLRVKFLNCSVDNASFRGFRHYSLDHLRSRFTLDPDALNDQDGRIPRLPAESTEGLVDQCSEDYQSLVRQVWETLLRIGPLVPARDLNGEPL